MIMTHPKQLIVDQTVRIEAPRSEVFKLIAEPDQIRRWQPVQIFEPRIGGRYHMQSGVHGAIGRIIGIDPPHSVSFTWNHENIGVETIVTFELKEDGAGTLVHLTHTGFTTSESAKSHNDGWAHYLGRLKTVATGGDAGPDTADCAASEAAERGPSTDFLRDVQLNVSRERAFDAIATIDGLRAWWTKTVTGSAAVGGEVRFIFDEADEWVAMRVDESKRPSNVSWTCVAQRHDGPQGGEWVGTRVKFDLIERSPETCVLRFQHAGLTPKLECFDECERGWNFFLASLAGLLERGKGQPYGT